MIRFDEHQDGGRHVFVRRDEPIVVPTLEEALRRENQELVKQLGEAVRDRELAWQQLREIREVLER